MVDASNGLLAVVVEFGLAKQFVPGLQAAVRAVGWGERCETHQTFPGLVDS
jgi:hypothetical protein